MNNAERSLRNAGNAAGDVLDRWVHDGVSMSPRWHGRITESTSDTTHPDALAQRAGFGEFAAMLHRLRVSRAEKRREQEEFRAWLQITAVPLW